MPRLGLQSYAVEAEGSLVNHGLKKVVWFSWDNKNRDLQFLDISYLFFVLVSMCPDHTSLVLRCFDVHVLLLLLLLLSLLLSL